MKFIIATNNAKKLKELERILKPLGIDAITAKEAGVNLSDVEETGKTFAENAYIKAYAAFKASGLPAIADDSGLSVVALDGRPGVYSARYCGEGATDEDKYNKILEEMTDVPDADRGAFFSCAICCVMSEDKKIEVEGRCNGTIAYKPFGNGGFGYDPIFMYGDKSFAEINAEEKDAISHRGIALRKLQEEIKKNI
ncbi:MAG: RdgB/HAM1 family non-canonical purine NTP pyrophosphatase [Ruminococcus sp.]|nr:RdgB/HAM1 family non-canonical purine NTP pyrophosphatase [Ruminococcus sp.]